MNTSKKEINLQQYSSSDIGMEQKTADLNFAIGLNRKVLKVLGLWTYPEDSQYQAIGSHLLVIFFTVTMFSFITIPQSLALIKIWGNLTLIIDNLMINIPVTISIFKMIIPWYNKKGITLTMNITNCPVFNCLQF